MIWKPNDYLDVTTYLREEIKNCVNVKLMCFIKTTMIGNMKFGEKLSFLRKQQGMTQMDLAEKLDVSRQAVSRWESGAAFP